MSGSCVNEFSVQLPGRHRGVYIPGDTVYGCLNLDLLQHISLTSIRITIKGRAFVHWTEQLLRNAGEPRFRDTRHHSASEEYFKQTLVLFGQTKNDKPDKCYLPAGKYSYPFQYHLPTSLPCSFEGELGYVRYWIRATIEKGREICHVTKLPFTVISPLDLNAVPDSNSPVQETAVKNLCCLCCFSGPINAMLCIHKRGYVPGEPIKFGAEVSNLSSRKIGRYSVELKMTTLFKTPTSCRSVTKQICKIKRHSVSKGETDTWMDQLVVPSAPPSCLIGCNIISIKYMLELRVDPVGPAFDLTLPIEIVIGTLPHRPVTPPHHYANVHYSNSNLHSDHGSNERHSGTSSTYHYRHPIGVPVLPVQGGHLIVNPAYAHQPSCQSVGVHPGTSGTDRNHGNQQRPPSRQSSAPSTTSTISLPQSHASAIFTESPFSPTSIKFDDDSDTSAATVTYSPLYPYYSWRK